MPESIRVAISGGGLAGASLMHALLMHSHLDVHIFESATAFKEAGAAVGIARNALHALDLIGPSMVQCLEKAGAVLQRGVRFMLAQGEDCGNMIDEVDDAGGARLTKIVHRAAFLRELLSDVSPDRMHTSKKLDRVERVGEAGPLILHFADGTTHDCDVLIGADGIRSTVRKIVLGSNDPAAHPRNAGWWAIMSLQPYAEARASLGGDLVDADDAREYMWIGNDTYILHNVLNDGQLVQFVVCVREEGAVGSDRWQKAVSAEQIRSLYKNWPPHLHKAVNELLCNKPEQSAIYFWEHPAAHTYISGPMCIIGDAAHATTPWQGSGCGMSLEDSLILSTLLGRCKTPREALVALRVYDHMRRPRTQYIVESSQGTGIIMTGKGKETGLDLVKLKENVLPRWDFIINFDNKKHCQEAIRIMEDELSK